MVTLLIFAHPARTPDISYKVGECSQKGPFFTSYMNPMAPKYILVSLSLSTRAVFVMLAGSGAPTSEPSVGTWSVSVIGGPYCALPKT